MRIAPIATLAACLALAASGCTTTSSTKAKALKGATGAANALEACRHVTVLDFAIPAGTKHVDVGRTFAQGIQARLANDFGTLFESVQHGASARGIEGECVVGGAITKYKPGSRVARAILIGVGSAKFEGKVSVEDASGAELLAAPFDKLWAWGGVLGASKGMDDMVGETSAAVASTIARGKGWQPPAAAN